MNYRILDRLSEEQRLALMESIRSRGLQVPIIRDHSGVILDGHERADVCAELGIRDYPTITLDTRNMDDRDIKLHIMAVNHQRRNPGVDGMFKSIDSLLRAVPDITDRYAASILFCSHHTIAKRKALLVANSEIIVPKTLRGADDRQWKNSAVYTVTAKEQVKASAAMTGMDVADVPAKPMTVRSIEKRKAKVDYRRKEAMPVEGYNPEDDIRFYHCDFRELAKRADIQPGSIHLVYTDPLYRKAHIGDYEELAQWGAKYLIPGGFLAAYCGNAYLDQIIPLMSKHLTYHWTCVLLFNELQESGKIKWSGSCLQYDRRMINGYRMMLLYTKGKARKTQRCVCDRKVMSGVKEKEHHEYQQDLSAMCYYIGELTSPGDTVADPFMGSAGSAIACRRLRRRFVGCDVAEAAYNGALKRMAGEQADDPFRTKKRG